MSCNKRLRQKLETILQSSRSPAQMGLVAEAALVLNEQQEALQTMERIRSKKIPAAGDGGQK